MRLDEIAITITVDRIETATKKLRNGEPRAAHRTKTKYL